MHEISRRFHAALRDRVSWNCRVRAHRQYFEIGLYPQVSIRASEI